MKGKERKAVEKSSLGGANINRNPDRSLETNTPDILCACGKVRV